MKLDLDIREKCSAPRFKSDTSFLELVMENVVGLDMVMVFIPCRLDCGQKPGHPNPEVLKTEALGTFWAIRICKQERTMVGQRGRKGMQDVRTELQVPFLIAEEAIKFA